MILSTPMLGIALYDYTPESVNFRKFFDLMEGMAELVEIPWTSLGLGGRLKLMTFKGGRKKIERDLSVLGDASSLSLLGGTSETGTNLDWKTSASFSNRKRDELCFCFEKRFIDESKVSLELMLKNLLTCADFQYGIVFERLYNHMPDGYAGGANGTRDNKRLSDEERKKIGRWMHQYRFEDGDYKTGLLRDVYPHNIFVETHLTQRVGNQTLRAWIESGASHGRLEKLTNQHWLWSLDPDQIPHAQEILQEAGLLLCYKV
jgi:hypothetical protein